MLYLYPRHRPVPNSAKYCENVEMPRKQENFAVRLAQNSVFCGKLWFPSEKSRRASNQGVGRPEKRFFLNFEVKSQSSMHFCCNKTILVVRNWDQGA